MIADCVRGIFTNFRRPISDDGFPVFEVPLTAVSRLIADRRDDPVLSPKFGESLDEGAEQSGRQPSVFGLSVGSRNGRQIEAGPREDVEIVQHDPGAFAVERLTTAPCLLPKSST